MKLAAPRGYFRDPATGRLYRKLSAWHYGELTPDEQAHLRRALGALARGLARPGSASSGAGLGSHASRGALTNS